MTIHVEAFPSNVWVADVEAYGQLVHCEVGEGEGEGKRRRPK